MADSGRPGDTPLTPEQSRQLNQQIVEKDAQDDADKEKEELGGSLVGMLPVMMGYDPYEPPPPPPPPPPPDPPTDANTAPDDYDPTWGTDDDDEEADQPNPDVIPINGDSTSTEEDIYADPGLGERGDPQPPPPDPTDPANATFIGAKSDPDPLENATFAPIGGKSDPAPSGRSPLVIGGALVGLVLLGAVGFAATRPSEPSAAPAPAFTPPPALTAPPTVAVTVAPPAAAAARVKSLTFSTPADGTSVCLQPVSFTLSVTLENAKAGDTVHIALTGPGMPAAGVTGTIDPSLTFGTKVGPVGPVKGRNMWMATVDTINGQPTAGVGATPIALCPSN